MLLVGTHIVVAEAVRAEEKKGVNTTTRLPAQATRWKKKILTQTADTRERSGLGFKIDLRSAKNRSQVFGDKQIVSIKEL